MKQHKLLYFNIIVRIIIAHKPGLQIDKNR